MANYQFEFIRSLNPNEVKSVQDFLRTMPVGGTYSGTDTKLSALFNYVIDEKNPIDDDIKIAKIIDTKNLASLRSDLIAKISEALTQNRFIDNNPEYSDYIANVYKLKKKMLFLRTVARTHHPKRTEFVSQLFFDIINTGKKYEVYDVLVEAYYFQKYFKGLRSGKEEFDKIQEIIDFYDVCNKAVWNAIDSYYSMTLNNDFIKERTKAEKLKFLTDTIQKIEKDYKLTKSVHVFYYLQQIKIEYYEETGNYKDAIKQCEKLIESLKGNVVTYSKERMGFANDNLARLYAYESNFKKAIAINSFAQQHFIENSLTALLSKENEFLFRLHNKDYASANVVLMDLLDHELNDSGKFRNDKYHFYKACLFFAQGKFKEAAEQIRSNLEIEKDKLGFNVHLRILNIMLLIEQEKMDEVSFAIESFRKYAERMKSDKENKIGERELLILSVLRGWEKNSFSNKKAEQQLLEMIIKLSEKNTVLSWNCFSNELIPFHIWISEKIKK